MISGLYTTSLKEIKMYDKERSCSIWTLRCLQNVPFVKNSLKQKLIWLYFAKWGIRRPRVCISIFNEKKWDCWLNNKQSCIWSISSLLYFILFYFFSFLYISSQRTIQSITKKYIYHFFACDWLKKLLFSTNSIAKLLSESLLSDKLMSRSHSKL